MNIIIGRLADQQAIMKSIVQAVQHSSFLSKYYARTQMFQFIHKGGNMQGQLKKKKKSKDQTNQVSQGDE